MYKILLVMAGGAAGSALRYLVSEFTTRNYSGLFPYGTLFVNLAGSFIIGMCWALFEQGHISANLKTFLFIGILGGFTTFSSFSAEAMNLFRENHIGTGITYILASNIIGLLLVFGGFFTGKSIVS